MKRLMLIASAVFVALALVGCGGEGFKDPDPPVGRALLPDIVPSPPEHVQMIKSGSRWLMQFNSVLVNIGGGDFILRAKRDPSNGEWHVDQVVPYSEAGAAVLSTPARLVWGGDGHEHWHVQRVAVNVLVRLDANDRPTGSVWTDSKVGFCFYDFARYKRVPMTEPHYVSRSCGSEGDRYIGMGLSVGWADIYALNLPGQSIDVTNVPDGRYRLIADVDRPRWFRERDVANNRTWVDISFSTRKGLRFAKVVGTGPNPGVRVVPLPHPETS